MDHLQIRSQKKKKIHLPWKKNTTRAQDVPYMTRNKEQEKVCEKVQSE